MKILVADDHPMVRDALARTVLVLDPEAEVVQACDFNSLERAIQEDHLDLALIDLNMPGMNGTLSVKRLRERFKDLLIVVASGEDDPQTIRTVMGLGVAGFLPKSDPPGVLLQALRLVLSGGTYLPEGALADLRAGHRIASSEARGVLTPRQLDVLTLLMQGQPNKLIARGLGLTEGTVKIHIAAILRLLHARNRTEAVVRARERGIAC
jgi:DNA-binding NarL/FixJ family response regulator